MQKIFPVIRKMTIEEMKQHRLQNFGLAMEHKGRTYRLTGGTGDQVRVFAAGAIIYVLSLNRNLSYVGLDAYMGSETDPVAYAFMQYDWELEDYLGKNWRELSDEELATKLINHLA